MKETNNGDMKGKILFLESAMCKYVVCKNSVSYTFMNSFHCMFFFNKNVLIIGLQKYV